MNGSMLTAQTDLLRRNGGAAMYRGPEIFPTRPRHPQLLGRTAENSADLKYPEFRASTASIQRARHTRG